MKKTCYICKIEKPMSEYYKARQSYCKDCLREKAKIAARKTYAKNRDKILAERKNWGKIVR